MDVASIIFAGIIINSLKLRFYNLMTKLNCILRNYSCCRSICGIWWACVLGLPSSFVPRSVDRAALLIGIANSLMGFVRRIPLGIAVSLACLTVIGLTASRKQVSTDNKLPYKVVVTTYN